jgi:hypothetical protein
LVGEGRLLSMVEVEEAVDMGSETRCVQVAGEEAKVGRS